MRVRVMCAHVECDAKFRYTTQRVRREERQVQDAEARE
jgi:hypothetical protein